jgi:hypothetical protein
MKLKMNAVNKINSMSVTTFHVLIATINRPCLSRMLKSLETQLLPGDYLTLVFDNHAEVPPEAHALVASFVCTVRLFAEPKALGFWGHAIRNKYRKLLDSTTFVMHADDDDTYDLDAFSKLRQVCTDPNTLYIAKMKQGPVCIPRPNRPLKTNNIGTPNGIIPFALNKECRFQLRHGGDGMFYEALVERATSIEQLDMVVYYVKDTSP